MFEVQSSCRTCMKTDHNLINLSESIQIDEENVQLTALLQAFVTIQVSHEDGLPQQICDDCVKVLQILHSFRRQVARSEKELKKIIQNESIKLEIKTENDVDNDFYDEINNTLIKDEEKSYSCATCLKNFTKKKKYQKHLLSHSSELVCLACDKSYTDEITLQKHMATEHEIDTKSTLKIKLEDKVNSQYICSVCCKEFHRNKSLSAHMKCHTSNLPADKCVCDICGKEFLNKGQLRRHMKLHTKCVFECDQCDKKYSRADQLAIHKRKHSNIKPNVCPHCNKGFSQVSNLKDHIRTHTGETPFLCSECGKGFANRSNLRQHMQRHTGVKPYACTMCPKKFTTKGQMTTHINTHSGAHPFKCDKCGASFTKGNSLKKHMRIHTGERPYQCDTCLMRFTCKDHLNRHYRIHTGEKPYRCSMCERAFSQSNDLAKHLRTHLGLNIYDCTICGSKFRLKTELTKHYSVHFGQNNTKDFVKHELQDGQIVQTDKQADVQTKQTDILKDNLDSTYMITINGGNENGMVTINILGASDPGNNNL